MTWQQFGYCIFVGFVVGSVVCIVVIVRGRLK